MVISALSFWANLRRFPVGLCVATLVVCLCVGMPSVWSAAPLEGTGSPEPVFHVDELVRLALRQNPQMESVRQEAEIYRGRVVQSTASYLPQVTAQSGFNRFRRHSGFSDRQTAEESDWISTGVTVSQHLYDFGQTDGKVAYSRHTLAAGEMGIAKTGADIVRNVRLFYFEVLKKFGVVQAGKESVRIQQAHLEQAQAFFQAGVRPKIDVTKSEVELANSRLRLVRAGFDLRAAYLDLENLTGGPPTAGAYRLADIPPPPLEPKHTEAALSDAFLLRPDLAVVREQIQAATSLAKASRASRFPALTADATYDLENDQLPLEENWQVGLNLTWPLFTGFRTTGRISEANAEIYRLQARQKEIELSIRREVLLAGQAVEDSAEAVRVSETALRQAEENMELADGRYQNGVGNAIEYADAELVLTQAKVNLIQARYDYLQSLTQLDYAAGRFVAADML
jgi:outer membrane protein TolC